MPIVNIPLKNAKPGMVLAKDVYSNNGKIVLCKKGAALNEKLIQRFETLGIEYVTVIQEISEEKRKVFLEEKLKLIEQAFLNKRGNCINMIKKALISYWNNKLLKDE